MGIFKGCLQGWGLLWERWGIRAGVLGLSPDPEELDGWDVLNDGLGLYRIGILTILRPIVRKGQEVGLVWVALP